MKILLTSALFMMGLLSSTEWFLFCPDTTAPHAGGVECRPRCSSTNNHIVVLKIEDTCYITISGCKSNKIMEEGKQVEATPKGDNLLGLLYNTIKDNIQISLSGKQADNTTIIVPSSARNDLHYHIVLEENMLILLARL